MRAFVVLLGITLVLTATFTVRCTTEKRDEFCSVGHGQTTLNGRVLDYYTQKPIDSIQISIVWGPSWDHFLDTLIKQSDSLSFVFNVPDDCEPYFITLSNRHYWTDLENHPAYKVSLDKGAVNRFDIRLKPATFFKINLSRDTLDSSPDTVRLQLKKAHTENWETWVNISADDFSSIPSTDLQTSYTFSDSATQRSISTYYEIESNFDYAVRWVRSNTRNPDTLYYHFTAKPFDTVQLYYRFRKGKN